MKNIFIITLLTTALVIQASAQTYKSEDNKVAIEVEKVTQTEDGENLHVTYRLTNASDLGLERVDFSVALLDAEKVEIGKVDVYDFHIPKRSKVKYNFNKPSVEFDTKKVDSFRLIPGSIMVIYKEGIKNQMLSNPSVAISDRQ